MLSYVGGCLFMPCGMIEEEEIPMIPMSFCAYLAVIQGFYRVLNASHDPRPFIVFLISLSLSDVAQEHGN